MKHLLNNISEEEKNRIREQHEGGMNLAIDNFKKLVETKLGDSKPYLSEESQETCEQCGGMMVEGECVEQCGSMKEEELDEQGIVSKVKAGVNSVGKGLEKRKDMRQERNAAAKKERTRGKVLSYNQDIVNKINQFINTLKNDDAIKSTFGGYIDYLDKVVKKDLNSKGNELKDMEI